MKIKKLTDKIDLNVVAQGSWECEHDCAEHNGLMHANLMLSNPKEASTLGCRCWMGPRITSLW